VTEQEIRKLLAVAMAYDNRKPGDMNVMAWTEAANRSRWSFEAALEAIHMHYAQSTEFLMPAHVTTLIRQAMRQPPRFEELPAAEPASEETRARVMDMVAELAEKKRVPE
jgi:hypothetical protein